MKEQEEEKTLRKKLSHFCSSPNLIKLIHEERWDGWGM
jgi:hypothetical protein